MAILRKAEQPVLSAYSPTVEQRKGMGMEPDDLLCSCNARPEKALVGHAQWEINQPPSLKRDKEAWKDGIGSLVILLLAERVPSEGWEGNSQTILLAR